MNLPDSEGPWYTMLAGLTLVFGGAIIGELGVLITLADVEPLAAFGPPMIPLGAALCCLGAPIWLFGSFWHTQVRSRERARLMAETLAILQRLEGPECRR